MWLKYMLNMSDIICLYKVKCLRACLSINSAENWTSTFWVTRRRGNELFSSQIIQGYVSLRSNSCTFTVYIELLYYEFVSSYDVVYVGT